MINRLGSVILSSVLRKAGKKLPKFRVIEKILKSFLLK